MGVSIGEFEFDGMGDLAISALGGEGGCSGDGYPCPDSPINCCYPGLSGLGITETNPDGPFGLGMYDNAANPWAFGEFDVQDWDAIPTQSDFGCGCGLGAAPAAATAVTPHGKKFPWLAVGVGAAGLALGVGLAFGLRKLLKRK